jgi:hypothetical protein
VDTSGKVFILITVYTVRGVALPRLHGKRLLFFWLGFLRKTILIVKGWCSVQLVEELNVTTFQTYVYMVKVGKPVGPRDLMRGANLSSPSVAYRNLQKLVDLGLIVKDEYGNYVVKEKVNMKGYVWVGKTMLPTFAIFGLVFVGVLISEIAILIPHLILGDPIQESFWLLTVVTVVSAVIFLVEAVRFSNRRKL